MHRIKAPFLFFLFFILTYLLFEKTNAQDQKGNARIIYFKSANGPLWNKQELDSFLIARTSKRSRLIPKITGIEEKGDSLIYDLNLVLNPNPTDIQGRYLKGQPLPDFNFKSIDGKEMKLKDLKGKPMVINFWFAGCIPCLAELPELNALKEKYKNSDVLFLSMTFEKKSTVINYLKKHPFNFIPISDVKAYCDRMTDLYPLTLFVDKNGIISAAEHLMPPLFNYDVTKRTDQLDPSLFEKNIDAIK
jgi:cytochrome c biogenesis protein CcmG, thiol:disulfide interchange protein DsbE